MKSKYIVQRQQPWRNLVIVVVLVVATGTGGYYLGEHSRESRDQRVTRLEMLNNNLRRENEALLQEGEELKARVAILERSRQVDGKAYDELDAYLKQLQGEILELREELAFYRGIVSSNETRGVLIHTFVVEREGNTNAYRYSLVLTRNMRSDRVVSGTVDLSVSGEMAGELKQLYVNDISGSEPEELKFKFKHFQRLEGRMILPKGFVPHRVYVKVQTRGGRASDVEKTFDWSRTVG